MSRWARWTTLAVMSLTSFAMSVWLGDSLLPWGEEARVGTGAGAGTVLAALVMTWGNSWPGLRGALEAPPHGAAEPWVVERPAEADEVIRALLRRPSGPAALGNALGNAHGTVGPTVGLHGPGGFGKTTLAESVCESPSVRRHFKGGVYPFAMGRDLRGSAAVAAKVNEVARLVTGDTSAFEDPQLAGRHLARLLARRPPTLLVIDDVWHPEQLAPFLHGGRHCARLVTTRVPSALPGDALRVRVDRMTPGQAARLLTWRLPAMDPALTHRLLKACGSWPLLLRLTNRILAADLELGRPLETSAGEVLARLRSAGPTAVDPLPHGDDAHGPGEAHGPEAAHGRGEAPTEPAHTGAAVRSTIEAGIRLLPGDGAARFRELGVFAEDAAIPVGLVTRLWRETAGLEPLRARRLCHLMADLSLVTLRPDAGTLALHDVVREYLRFELGAERLIRLSAQLLDAAAGGLPAAEPLAAPGSASAEPGPGTAWWLSEDPYLGKHLISHLLDAGRTDQAEATAGDLRWVEARLAEHGPSVPYADLSLIRTERSAARARALARSAHLLTPTSPRHSLASVLHSRIQDEDCWRDQARARRDELRLPQLVSVRPLPDLLDTGCQRTLTGHTGRVASAIVAPDGRWLASAGWDGTVRIWNPRTGEELRTLTGHTNIVTCVAASPDGSWLATTSWDGTARLWDPRTGEELRTLDGHTNIVTAAAVSPDGDWLVTTGADHSVRMWDPHTGEQLRTFGGHGATVTAVAVAPDGAWLATSGADGVVRIWDAASGRCRRTLNGHNGRVAAVAVDPGGRRLATAGEDRIVQIWDAVTGRYERTLTGHTDTVTGLAVGPGGTWLASTGDDHTTRVWDLRSGQETRTLTGHTDSVTAAAVSPDGRWLATTGADRTVRVWNAGVGPRRRTRPDNDRRVTELAVAPEGTLLATAEEDGTVQLWDAASGGHRHTLEGHTGRVTGLAFSPAGPPGGETDGTSRPGNGTGCGGDADDGDGDDDVAEDVTGGLAGDVAGDLAGDVTGDAGADARRATGTESGRSPGRDGGRDRGRAPGRDGALDGESDGGWLATGSRDGTVRLWDRGTGRHLRTLTGHTDRITGLAGSPDGRLLATAGSNFTVRVWDTDAGRHLRTLVGHTDRITGLAFVREGGGDSDGPGAAGSAESAGSAGSAGSNGGPGEPGHRGGAGGARLLATAGRDGTVRLWNCDTGRQLRQLAAAAHRFTALAAAPDGDWIAAAAEDHTVTLWSTATGEQLLTLSGHTDRITGLAAVPPDGARLVTAGTDHTVRLWDTAGGDCVAMMRADDDFRCCAWVPGGGALVAGGKRGFYVFEVRNDERTEPRATGARTEPEAEPEPGSEAEPGSGSGA